MYICFLSLYCFLLLYLLLLNLVDWLHIRKKHLLYCLYQKQEKHGCVINYRIDRNQQHYTDNIIAFVVIAVLFDVHQLQDNIMPTKYYIVLCYNVCMHITVQYYNIHLASR
jgi:hypothetical protein